MEFNSRHPKGKFDLTGGAILRRQETHFRRIFYRVRSQTVWSLILATLNATENIPMRPKYEDGLGPK